MLVKILGSAAGGGFPQWNCACFNCSEFRHGSLRARARTQTQVAFSPLPGVWFLIGASPDLRSQLLSTRELLPTQDNPSSPIAGVFLPCADVDAVMGLLHLREFASFFVFAGVGVQRILKEQNRIFRVLDRGKPPVQWQLLSSKRRVGCHLSGDSGGAPTFFYTAVPLGCQYPDYADEDSLGRGSRDEACVGFLIEQEGKKLLMAPTISSDSSEWAKLAASADVALLDGTFWSDQELLATGRTNKTARQLGHLPISGPEGLLAQYPKDVGGRKILIHVNNTNPILDENSTEHRAVVEAGFEIAYDGLSIEL